MGGELLGRGRLPHHDVAEQGGRGRQVPRDRGEVERGDGQDETLQRPVLHPVPDPRAGLRLLRQQPPRVVNVVAPEVDQLAGGVDLGLVHRLGLAEDGGRVDRRPPRAAQQVGGLEHDRGPVVERQRPPGRRRRRGRVDRGRHVLFGRVAHGAEHVPVVVRRDHVDRLPAARRWRPPMVMVSSARSPASSLSLPSRTARSGLPGGYCRTGSLCGGGTLVTASMARLPDLPGIIGGLHPIVAR